MQLCWLAGDDPIKMEALHKMPVIEYFSLLDKKIADVKTAQRNAQKKANG